MVCPATTQSPVMNKCCKKTQQDALLLLHCLCTAGRSAGSHCTSPTASSHEIATDVRLGSWDVDAIAATVKEALCGRYNKQAKILMQIVKEQVVAEELERRRRPQLEETAKRKAEVHKVQFIIRLQNERKQDLRWEVTQLEKRLAATTPTTSPSASKVSSRV
jgi:hypothetical protein